MWREEVWSSDIAHKAAAVEEEHEVKSSKEPHLYSGWVNFMPTRHFICEMEVLMMGRTERGIAAEETAVSSLAWRIREGGLEGAVGEAEISSLGLKGARSN